MQRLACYIAVVVVLAAACTAFPVCGCRSFRRSKASMSDVLDDPYFPVAKSSLGQDSSGSREEVPILSRHSSIRDTRPQHTELPTLSQDQIVPRAISSSSSSSSSANDGPRSRIPSSRRSKSFRWRRPKTPSSASTSEDDEIQARESASIRFGWSYFIELASRSQRRTGSAMATSSSGPLPRTATTSSSPAGGGAGPASCSTRHDCRSSRSESALTPAISLPVDPPLPFSQISERLLHCRICQDQFTIAAATVINPTYDGDGQNGTVLDVCSRALCIATLSNVAAVSDSLKGPVWPAGDLQITCEFVVQLQERLRCRQPIPVHLISMILEQLIALLERSHKDVLEINVDIGEIITICGEINGQFSDLLNIWYMNGYPSVHRRYIIAGDFDHGENWIECILSLLAWKLSHPDAIHLIRGHHECRRTNTEHGLREQIEKQYPNGSNDEIDLFTRCITLLPRAALLNGDHKKPKAFVVHGGLPAENVILDGRCFQRISRRIHDSPEADCVGWSVRCSIDPETVSRFLQSNHVQLIIRSHERTDHGYELTHDGRVINVFSASNYYDFGNDGAYLHLDHDLNVVACRYRDVKCVKMSRDVPEPNREIKAVNNGPRVTMLGHVMLKLTLLIAIFAQIWAFFRSMLRSSDVQ